MIFPFPGMHGRLPQPATQSSPVGAKTETVAAGLLSTSSKSSSWMAFARNLRSLSSRIAPSRVLATHQASGLKAGVFLALVKRGGGGVGGHLRRELF